MNAFENLKTFLYDQKYFISIYNNNIHVNAYLDIINFTNELISLKFDGFYLEIHGKNLKIVNMQEGELVINGKFNNINFIDEKHNK